MSLVIDVAAAVLLRDGDQGAEFLLAQRPEGKVYAGYWEFPGGKVEPGESLHQALVRELREELGITVDRAWPWLCRQFTYPHATVKLKFFRVPSWHGTIAPIEHTGFSWTRIGSCAEVAPILPANGPILQALALPAVYALTNASENGVAAELARLKVALENGLQLIQVRDKNLPASERRSFAAAVIDLARQRRGAVVLINDDEALARQVGASGLHLSSPRLMALQQRPAFERVAASCHSAKELAHAAALGLDFAVLGPVLPTPTHPEAKGTGWEAFSQLIENASLPVYALGGMKPEMLETARTCGAHGVALLRGWR